MRFEACGAVVVPPSIPHFSLVAHALARQPVRVVEPVCRPCPLDSEKLPPVNPVLLGPLPFWRFLERENTIARLAEASKRAAPCAGRQEVENRYGLGLTKGGRLDVKA